MLRMAIQKSGRLSDRTRSLLEDADIHLPNGRTRQLTSTASNFPLQLFYLRDDDIPEYVADGMVDAGIVGENVIEEKGKSVDVIEKLGFGKCRLSIAMPRQQRYERPGDLSGLNIATSYPQILSRYLSENDVQASIHLMSGSVEITPVIGLAEAIFDIVSTGNTLISNGLKEVVTVMHSEAVLIANQQLGPEQRAILEKLAFRIRSVNSAQTYKYILLNSPAHAIDRITEILPGMKSPTVMPLAEEGWCSIHTVIREDDFWEIIDTLKSAGAQGILVLPIEKMIV